MQGTKKQVDAYVLLVDNQTKEIFYGGAAGGGKSYLGCFWLITACIAYPGSRWFIAREELKRLTQSTLITFAKVAQALGVRYDLNSKYNFIVVGDSQIDLLDIRYLPSDPLYERFGSLEYTGGWIEEGGETNYGAYEVLKTRIGRHKNDVYNLISKLLVTCNPKKNWLYTEIYKPFKENRLADYIKFIQAFVTDNPHLTQDYIDNLKNTKDKSKRERLLHGNWEYDDDPSTLCDYDKIQDIFTNPAPESKDYYITADVARMGSDKAIIAVWSGWSVIEFVVFEISKTTEIQNAIRALQAKHKIGNSATIADEDGVGGGIVDNLRIKGFINNSKALKDENYYNLQSQCCYGLAEKINDNSLSIQCDISPLYRQEIIEEMEQLKTYDSDKDGKLRILPKEIIKQNIGRSPDWRDVLMMRKYFDYNLIIKFAPKGIGAIREI